MYVCIYVYILVLIGILIYLKIISSLLTNKSARLCTLSQ